MAGRSLLAVVTNPRTHAAETLGELANLSKAETTRLHNASKGWRNPELKP